MPSFTALIALVHTHSPKMVFFLSFFKWLAPETILLQSTSTQNVEVRTGEL
jgi:hypothetical protein